MNNALQSWTPRARKLLYDSLHGDMAGVLEPPHLVEDEILLSLSILSGDYHFVTIQETLLTGDALSLGVSIEGGSYDAPLTAPLSLPPDAIGLTLVIESGRYS